MHRTPGATIYLLWSNVVLGLVTAEPYDHSETCMTAQQPIDQAATATEHAPSCDSLDRRAKACDRIVCPHRTLGIYALVHVSPIHSLLPQQPLRTLPCGVSASPHCGAFVALCDAFSQCDYYCGADQDWRHGECGIGD